MAAQQPHWDCNHSTACIYPYPRKLPQACRRGRVLLHAAPAAGGGSGGGAAPQAQLRQGGRRGC